MDTDQMFSEAMRRFTESDVPIEHRSCDISDDQAVALFMSKGCAYLKWKGKPCSKQFSLEYVQQVRLSFKNLQKSDLDLIIIGELIACSLLPHQIEEILLRRNFFH